MKSKLRPFFKGTFYTTSSLDTFDSACFSKVCLVWATTFGFCTICEAVMFVNICDELVLTSIGYGCFEINDLEYGLGFISGLGGSIVSTFAMLEVMSRD